MGWQQWLMLPDKGSKESDAGDRPAGRQESRMSQGTAGMAAGGGTCVPSDKRPGCPANKYHFQLYH